MSQEQARPAKASRRGATKESEFETRDRAKPIKVLVSDGERAELNRLATVAGLPLSSYLRTAALRHQTRSTLDYDAAMAIAKVGGDIGRLGGLLKLWLAEGRNKGASSIDVNRLLKETRELQDRLRDLVGRM